MRTRTFTGLVLCIAVVLSAGEARQASGVLPANGSTAEAAAHLRGLQDGPNLDADPLSASAAAQAPRSRIHSSRPSSAPASWRSSPSPAFRRLVRPLQDYQRRARYQHRSRRFGCAANHTAQFMFPGPTRQTRPGR